MVVHRGAGGGRSAVHFFQGAVPMAVHFLRAADPTEDHFFQEADPSADHLCAADVRLADHHDAVDGNLGRHRASADAIRVHRLFSEDDLSEGHLYAEDAGGRLRGGGTDGLAGRRIRCGAVGPDDPDHLVSGDARGRPVAGVDPGKKDGADDPDRKDAGDALENLPRDEAGELAYRDHRIAADALAHPLAGAVGRRCVPAAGLESGEQSRQVEPGGTAGVLPGSADAWIRNHRQDAGAVKEVLRRRAARARGAARIRPAASCSSQSLRLPRRRGRCHRRRRRRCASRRRRGPGPYGRRSESRR